MRELPILFNAPMVRAILEGRKTVTRRIVKPSPYLQEIAGTFGGRLLCFPDRQKKGRGLIWPNAKDYILEQCPYGRPGDKLWVKETHALQHGVDGDAPPFSTGRPIRRAPDDDIDGVYPAWTQAHYRATDPAPDLCCERENCAQCRDHDMGPHWRPSIHMPRWASRITLEVTGVRVERLQDITEAQAEAEGCAAAWLDADDNSTVQAGLAPTYRQGFARLWREINGDESWGLNPWVWVVGFNHIKQKASAS